ncbi:MAG: RtcB family protein [Deltaproteobacteria bacterium]|nr:RtcB family protein [Deltaproteobacteria bacterium]
MAEKNIPVKKIDGSRWMIERRDAMRTTGLIYASEAMLPKIMGDQSLQQVSAVACLPGIVGSSLAMPDIHWGYGFPIGGVAAFDVDAGVVSPGGVGYDINCGVRLMRTGLGRQDIAGHVERLIDALFCNIPSGLGSKRSDLKLGAKDQSAVLEQGAAWAVKRGFGENSELEHIEDHGCIEGADPEAVSDRALERGRQQLGTLGSGNHFVEIACVDEVFDSRAAAAMGLDVGRVVVSVHTGSRGLGYQVCDDSIKTMLKAAQKYGISLPDRQLCCAPVASPEGGRYIAAMSAAANFAFANRQIIGHWVRETFEQVLGLNPAALRMALVYDVCHNIAKVEEHTVNGRVQMLCVHRKGATRAFGPGHARIPEDYRSVGQPVLVPGDMGRCSYVLAGTQRSMQETFGSCCHGAGRAMSRNQAQKAARGRRIDRELEQAGIYVRAAGRGTLTEEMPEAYKDVNEVVDVVAAAGLAVKVARLKPLGVMKG